LTQAVINSGLLPALFLVTYGRTRKTDLTRPSENRDRGKPGKTSSQDPAPDPAPGELPA
jgi:hypothetical protein